MARKITPKQARTIAAGLVSGVSQPEIAEAAGVSTSCVAHAKDKPVVRDLLRTMTTREEERLNRLWVAILESLIADLDSHPELDDRRAIREEAVRVIQLANGSTLEARGGEGSGEGLTPSGPVGQINLAQALITFATRREREQQTIEVGNRQDES